MEWQKYPDDIAAATAGGRALTRALEGAGERPVLLLLSGRSALKILEFVAVAALSDRVTIGMLDERLDSVNNNFVQLQGTAFFRAAESRGCVFIDTRPRAEEKVSQLAERMESAWREWKILHANGIILVTLGIGADGHMVGMMSYPESPELFGQLFVHIDQWVVGYDAKEKNEYPLRATATVPFLTRQVERAFVYAVGAEKKNALELVQSAKEDVATVPARTFYQMRQVDIFIT